MCILTEIPPYLDSRGLPFLEKKNDYAIHEFKQYMSTFIMSSLVLSSIILNFITFSEYSW